MKKTIIKVLIGVAIFIAIIVAIVLYVIGTSKKFVCTGDQGSITLYYKDGKITGYKGNGYSYDLDEQQEIAERIGIDTYLEEFNSWFLANSTNGKCEKK